MNLCWQTRLIWLLAGLFIGLGGACQLFGGYTSNFLELVFSILEFLFGSALVYSAISPMNVGDSIHPDKILFVDLPSKYASEEEWIEYHAKLGRVAEHNYRLTNKEKDLEELVYLWKNYSSTTFKEILRDVSPEVIDALQRRIKHTNAQKYKYEEIDSYEYYE